MIRFKLEVDLCDRSVGFCLYVSVGLEVCLSVRLSVSLSVSLSASLSVCLSVRSRLNNERLNLVRLVPANSTYKTYYI